MALTWLTAAEMDRHLRSRPRLYLHPRLDLDVPIDELRRVIPIAPEVADFLPGLGDFAGWGLLAGGMPCSLSALPDPEDGRRRSLPPAMLGTPWELTLDGQLDLRLLGRLEALPGELLRGVVCIVDAPYSGAGFEVQGPGGEVVYRTARAERAREVAAWLDRYRGRAHRVVPSAPVPASWIVAGPRRGEFVCALESMASREAAEQRAASNSRTEPGPWMVFEGQVGERALALFRGGARCPCPPHALYRQDDNGQRVRMALLPAREDAEEMVEVFTARGHKQFYWTEPG